VAFEAAYRHGHEWLADLMRYLQETRDMVSSYLKEHIPKITVAPAQGTYLLWLDCRQLNLESKQLEAFFLNEAKLAMSPGRLFGKGGEGFMRMNIGTSQANVLAALEKLKAAII
jgi:cystathionine beta-lyase